MERPCTGLVFLQACQWSFFVAVITLGLRLYLVLPTTWRSAILLFSIGYSSAPSSETREKSRENPEKETVCITPCCVWETLENSVNTGDKAERQPRKESVSDDRERRTENSIENKIAFLISVLC